MTTPVFLRKSGLAWIGQILSDLTKLSWAWRITLGYLSLMLLLPISAMLLKASTTQPADFFRIALSPVALSTYDVTFTTALIAAAIQVAASAAPAAPTGDKPFASCSHTA